MASADPYTPDYLDAEDPDIIDVESSLDYRYSEEGRATWDGDLRGGYFNSSEDLRDGGSNDTDNYTLRFRYGVNLGFTDHARLKARLAATCSV